MNDETVIALLKESVPPVPDVPSRYASVRALAGRQRSYARMQAIGAVASVVLVLGAVVAVTRGRPAEVRPVKDPVATMTAAFLREEWVSFETKSRLTDATGGVTEGTTHGTKHRGDFVSFGGFIVGSPVEGFEVRSVRGTMYTALGLDPSTLPPGVRWIRTSQHVGFDLLGGTVSKAARYLRDVRRVGTGTERGVGVTRYTARAVSSKGTVTVSFALDAQGRPRRVVADGPAAMMASAPDGDVLHLEIDFFDYGVARPVEAPPPGETVDQDELSRNGGCTPGDHPTQADADACAARQERLAGGDVRCTGRVEPDGVKVECTNGMSATYGPRRPFTPVSP